MRPAVSNRSCSVSGVSESGTGTAGGWITRRSKSSHVSPPSFVSCSGVGRFLSTPSVASASSVEARCADARDERS
eukprot:557773-Pleurochrysis_carterae.AAC.2